MMADNIYTTKILLLNTVSKNENKEIKKWFRQSRYLTWVAVNISQAIEMIYDFTVSQTPDVILLDTESFSKDFDIISRMIAAASVGAKISLLALSDPPKRNLQKDCFLGNFEQIKIELDKTIPRHAHATA